MQVEAEQSPRERGRWKSDAPSNLSSGQFCLGERPVKAVASTIERGSIGQRGVSRMLTPLCHWGWQKSQNQSPDRTWSVVSGAKEIFVTQKWSKCCVYETFLSPAHLVWTLYLQTAELTRMNTNQIQRFKSDLIKLETGLNQIWGKGGGFYPSWSGDLRKYFTDLRYSGIKIWKMRHKMMASFRLSPFLIHLHLQGMKRCFVFWNKSHLPKIISSWYTCAKIVYSRQFYRCWCQHLVPIKPCQTNWQLSVLAPSTEVNKK